MDWQRWRIIEHSFCYVLLILWLYTEKCIVYLITFMTIWLCVMKTMINLWLPSVVKMLQYLFNVFRYWQRQKQTESYIRFLSLLVVLFFLWTVWFSALLFDCSNTLQEGSWDRDWNWCLVDVIRREIEETRKTIPLTKHSWTILILREVQTRISIIKKLGKGEMIW